MELSMLEKCSDMAQAYSTIKMDPFMMDNGTKIKSVEEVRCCSQMAHFMMDSGIVIKCMGQEYS